MSGPEDQLVTDRDRREKYTKSSIKIVEDSDAIPQVAELDGDSD